MKVCHCTLPYTNPEACRACQGYEKDFSHFKEAIKILNSKEVPRNDRWKYDTSTNKVVKI